MQHVGWSCAVTVAVLVTSCTSGPADSVGEGSPSASPSPVPAQDDRFADFVPCPEESLGNAFIGTWLCGSVEVPLDRSDPASETLTLPVFVMQHTDLTSPALTPFFTTPGGPGGPGFENFGLYAMQDAGLVEHHDIVTMDPRGTGATAIDCPDLQDGFASKRQRDKAVAACAKLLGPSSDRYGSAERAMDLEAVRELLGYDLIDYYAPSYGGVDGQAYAVRYPERLRSLVIDSSFRIDDVDDNLGAGVPADLLSIVAAICQDDGYCRTVTDDAVPVLTRLVREVARKPLVGKDPDTDARVVVDEVALGGLLYNSDISADLVPAAVAALDGDPSDLLTLAAAHPFWSTDASDPKDFSQGANVAGQCNDLVLPWDSADSVPERRRALAQAIGALPDADVAPFSRRAWTTLSWADYCVPWPAPDRYEPVLPSGATLPAVPTLVLYGSHDTWIPGVFTRRLATEFPTAELVMIPGAGHPSLNDGSGCSQKVIAAFIETLALDLQDCAQPG